jgi:hypothetical protein
MAPYHVENLTRFNVSVDPVRGRVVNIEFYPSGPDETQQAERLDLAEFEQSFDATSDESEAAERIATSHAAVKEVIGDRESLVRTVTYAPGEHRFGTVYLDWEGGGPLEGDWPVMVDRDPDTWDYRSETIHVTKRFASELEVTVDLHTEQVISMEAFEGD